ncbi:CRM1 C terminal-domain-containing protein [Sporodiniella umbellata]|nr:CRM1 C terminal-domain-containing protein [Sporodiniella umbellata]
MDFNVAEFDKVARTFYEGEGSERSLAEKRLIEFRNDPNSWQTVDLVLEQSTYMNTKFLVFDVFEEFVRVRWNTLSGEQQFTLRNSIANLVVHTSSKENVEHSHALLLRKLNGLLVQIIEKECPRHWPTFIEEIVNSSFTNVNLCKNNMQIIKLLSEELYGQPRNSLTQTKIRKLKKKLVDDFALVFDLLKKVLSTPTLGNETLLTTAMETLREIIAWMPLEYAVQTDFLNLVYAKLHQDSFRLLALQCFNEIVGSHSNLPHEAVAAIYQSVFPEISKAMNLYQQNNELSHLVVKEAATFIIAILSNYQTCVLDTYQALLCLISICQIPNSSLFELCVDFWDSFLKLNKDCSVEIKEQLANMMIEKMVMPNEFFEVGFEYGETTFDFVEQSDTGVQCQAMQSVLQTLSIQNPLLVQTAICEKLSSVFEITEDKPFFDALFRISWSLGALSEAFATEQENVFIEKAIYSYIQLLQCRSNLQHAITCCIFYICSRYILFLLYREDFANLVWEKIFSFMKETEANRKHMACYTLLKISERLRKCPAGSNAPLQSLISNVVNVSESLQPQQMYMVYEAATNIMCAAPTSSQQEILYLLMNQQNQKIGSLTYSNNISFMKAALNYFKINIAVCKVAGKTYSYQLAQMVAFTTECYNAASTENGVQNRKNNEEIFSNVKQSILELLEVFVLKSNVQPNMAEFQVLLQVVLSDYYQRDSEREPKVLSLLSALVEKTESLEILNEATQVALVHTLPMIVQNFSDYPEIREQFYYLLKAITQRRFQDIIQEPTLLKQILDSVLWGTKHTAITVSHTALRTCLYILDSVVEEEEDISSLFFETYYVRILTEILEVLVDSDLRNGFEYQSQILARMLMMVQEGEIYTRVFDPEQVSNPLMSNAEFLQQYVLNLLLSAFPMLQKSQIEVFVMGMFNYSYDLEKFQEDIEDFLVDIKTVDEISAGEERLYEEKEAENDLMKNL